MICGTAQTFTGQKCFVGGQECQDMRNQRIFRACRRPVQKNQFVHGILVVASVLCIVHYTLKYIKIH